MLLLKRSRLDEENSRPISNLPLISELAEKAVARLIQENKPNNDYLRVEEIIQQKLPSLSLLSDAERKL